MQLTGIKYFQAKDPQGKDTWNAYILLNNQMYRVRVEVLVYNNKGEIFVMKAPGNKYGTDVTIPGGSAEPNKSFEQQVKEETLEEAGCNIKNIRYSGQHYITSFNGQYPEWHKHQLWPLGYKYEGTVTYVFTAEFVNAPGYSSADPWDIATQSKFKFMNPNDCKLLSAHKQALLGVELRK